MTASYRPGTAKNMGIHAVQLLCSHHHTSDFCSEPYPVKNTLDTLIVTKMAVGGDRTIGSMELERPNLPSCVPNMHEERRPLAPIAIALYQAVLAHENMTRNRIDEQILPPVVLEQSESCKPSIRSSQV